ncbi:MAG: histidine kinase [Saprospiraceae bacterium]
MKFRKEYILLFLLVFCVSFLQAQDKKKMKSSYTSKRQSTEQLLEQARQQKENNPTEAIRLVELAIDNIRGKKRRKREEEADAFVLLGSIYEQIDQKELAIGRYQQALSLVSKKDGESRATIFERLGQLHLASQQNEKAEDYFQQCIKDSSNKTLTLICTEGIADVNLKRKDLDAAADMLDDIEANYQLDSIGVSRNEARRAQVYVQQNDYGRAEGSFQNSIDNLPTQEKISKQEAAPIEEAKEQLLAYSDVTNDDKIKIRSNVANDPKVNASFSTEALVLENLEIAELHESNKNFLDAERFVVVAKDLIDKETDADVVADVYKKSSELNQRKGKIDLALNDLENYISAKETAIQKLEKDLTTQVEIVKSQKQIDLQQLDYDLEEKDQALLASRLRTQQIITGLLTLVLLASLVFFYFLYKNVKEKRKANQLLLLKSLRAQMNPHFIFNALNSVNNFIAKNDEKAANKFLSDFSKLMRKVLDYSQKDFISFEEEMELNELYLKLEHFRFRDKFEYEFENKTSLKNYSLDVPPMLIQPFIENAIWHGLRYKTEKGKLKVIIEEQKDHLLVTVSDNGIGRTKSKSLKTKNQKKYKSTGMENVSKSMALINEIYGKSYDVQVSDLNQNEETGTMVKIQIPLN